MTYRIIWEPGVTDAAVRFLKDDPVGLAAVHLDPLNRVRLTPTASSACTP
ncbi:hypothetical protein STRIP9103_03808 [Streptomyces ipomoeae 91-03]|uniref:Type II toxin-antitoxin system RelE/ParE family toxin n=1 Tax=Streptomyces ipomoeae 91-03 TaxID=698759 RepID=L1KZL1_9ACTN|nr:hypothetical protein STRIP9103_03808 [Streptomyces ipomoeae 91-03]